MEEYNNINERRKAYEIFRFEMKKIIFYIFVWNLIKVLNI